MSMSLQLLLIMGLLTILPSLILMMTSFTRILIVLAILRQAIGIAAIAAQPGADRLRCSFRCSSWRRRSTR
jgi:flagellar biosynthesis protein FliP